MTTTAQRPGLSRALLAPVHHTAQEATMTEIEDQAVQILSNEGAQCGNCGDEPGDRVCPDCEKCRRGYVAALIAAGWGPRAEADAELAKLRDLLRVENKRANDAIDREETAEQAALEATVDRAAFAAEAVAELEALRDKTDVNVAVYPRYDARQRSALDDGIRLLRRMADETQQAEAQAAADCPYGEGPGDGSGRIKPAGHDGDHVVTAGVPVDPCRRAALHQPHMPHSWRPQPGMAYAHCPGATTEAQQAGEDR